MSLSREVSAQGVSLSRSVSVQGVSLSRSVSVQGGLCSVGLCPGLAGGSLSGGGGVLSRRGLCHGDPPGMMEERAVRILLECTLVSKMFTYKIKVLFLKIHFKYAFYNRRE